MSTTYHLKVDPVRRIVTADEILLDLEARGGELPEDYDLSLAAAAVLANVDVSTIHRWACSGRLPTYWTSNGRRRFRESDIRAVAAEARP